MSELISFFRHRWIELLVAGIWLQSVVSAAFTGSLALLAITTLGGLALLVAIFGLAELLRHRRRPVYGDSEAFGTPRQAIIFTVGMQKHTILFALEQQKPARLGLICTRLTGKIADEIETASGLDADHIQKEIVDPWSVVEVRDKTTFILDWLTRHGVERAEIAVDITGGTAIMSAAAFSLATEWQVDCQYVRSDYGDDNKPIPKTQRAMFVTRHG